MIGQSGAWHGKSRGERRADTAEPDRLSAAARERHIDIRTLPARPVEQGPGNEQGQPGRSRSDDCRGSGRGLRSGSHDHFSFVDLSHDSDQRRGPQA